MYQYFIFIAELYGSTAFYHFVYQQKLKEAGFKMVLNKETAELRPRWGIGEQMGWFTQKRNWGRTQKVPVCWPALHADSSILVSSSN